MDFKDKVALVTGASRGIGRAVALKLASCGASVVVNYASNKELAEEVLGEIEAMGSTGQVRQFDVSDSLRVREEVSSIARELGGLHILVNNAGINRDSLLVRMKEEDWDEVLTVNLKGMFNTTKIAARVMMKQRFGRIINLTSVIGEMGNPGQSNYSASKSGIIGFTKSVAKELGPRGITVNAVSPGFIDTDMTRSLSDSVKEQYLKGIALGRFGSPEDVAGVVAFLASEEASYITGEVIRINGGIYT
ncbi:MAG: 3-oxoacyl-[acyl-carrier-protein] reductase [Candidatus Dadabacteria bacterium]|nr:3-oxoacyl-[acyl-carrier-protein] reductase [Candidatus Dadabacteria bacterium]